jgi:DNA-binding winged helix-turn-helix (wHTH) protein/tetratricopeptide (TPR) repeat protein
MPHSEKPVETIHVGPFEVDLRARELRKHGVRVRLSGQPFEVLALLLERPGDVVTRKELQERLWPKDTFVDFEHGLNNAIKKLRAALGDSAEAPLYVETLARIGYRFVAPVARPPQIDPPGTAVKVEPPDQVASDSGDIGHRVAPALERSRRSYVGRAGLGIALATVVAALAGWQIYRAGARKPAFGERVKVVVADFVNATGEPAFDLTLREGVEVDLGQSPFVDVMPRPQIWAAMQMMGRSADETLTDKTGLEICQRANAQALLAGSIVGLGQHYVITVDALNCRTGDSVAVEQAEADNKESVLRALGQATRQLRVKLGESVASLQQFGTPLEQATTTSLDALKAFTLGDEQRARGKNAEAIPFFEHAVDLDPNFALGYARIGAVYYNMSEVAQAKKYFTRAFEMRDRVSPHERLYLSARYYENVTRERPKAIANYTAWRSAYPREWIPANNLANLFTEIGQYDKAIPQALDAVRLNPDHAFPYVVLARAYKRSTRYAESKRACEQAIGRRLDGWAIHSLLFQMAYADRDEQAMRRQLEWAKGTSDASAMLGDWAASEATSGHIRKALDLYRRSRDEARARDLVESEAAAEASSALVEAVVGDRAQAREHAGASLRLSQESGPMVDAMLALAFVGDGDKAEQLASELSHRWPLDTLLIEDEIPTVRASIAIDRKNPNLAIDLLRSAAPYELRDFEALFARGLADLEARQGGEATGEFQKILDHQGVDPVSLFIPLARLGLGRARAVEGDSAGARSAYQSFFAAWKDADADLPVLLEARREAAALK